MTWRPGVGTTALRRAAAALAVAATTALWLASGPAARASEPLGLSWDGNTWTDALTGTLFDAPAVWVPGDSAVGQFYVRDRSTDPAILRLDTDLPVSPLIGPHAVQVTVRIGEGSWQSVATGSDWLRIDSVAMRPGSDLRVDVRATFNPDAGNDSQDHVEPLRFRVTLTGGASTSGPPPSSGAGGGPSVGPGNPSGPAGPSQPPGGGLANTGVPPLGWTIVIAAVAIGVGAGLSRRGAAGRHGRV